MLPLHRQRDPNGLVKSVILNVNHTLQLANTFGGYTLRFIPPSLVKAQNAAERETKLSTNKIKIIAVLIKLWVQNRNTTATDVNVLETPFAIEIFRQAQTTANENAGRYNAGTAHILKHTFITGDPTPTPLNTYSICSPYNLPLDIAARGFVHMYNRFNYVCRSLNVGSFDANTVNKACFQAPLEYVDITQKVDCYVNITDNGNPASVVSLDAQVGELPEILMLTLYDRKRVPSAYQAYGEYYVQGTIQYVYQEIGETLSHLL